MICKLCIIYDIMKNLSKIEKILNLVQKPARYINSELNSHPADMSADFSVALCFPDIYEVGASNLGLEILYHLVNEKKLARCERAFAPDTDLEDILRRENLKLFSLESHSELRSFDILGITIQCELVATNVVNILDLSGVSIFSKDRKEDEPLVIAGGPALTNPEPFCDFFDLFVLGDGEEALQDIIRVCKEAKKNKLSRLETLKKLSSVEGVYVPSFYDVQYNDDNTVKSVTPISSDIKPVVKKRLLNLENAYFPEKKIIPFVETVHNRLNIEVARGCPGQCRFCQASKYYRPWRQRPLEKLLGLVKKGIEATGFEEIAFSSLSCSDYKRLDKLLIETNNLYGDSKLNISLPSLRCNERSLKVAQYINRSKRPTLTFAPEAGSDRLRNVIGKYLSEKQIVETLLTANAMGWKAIKLYFMIGLPTETDEDLSGIERLVKLVKKEARGLNFTVTVSPFVPKSQTAFQWASMASADSIKQKIDFLHKFLPADVKTHNLGSSVLEALIAKGDRRLSIVIYKAWQKGARFDQWADKFGNNIWDEALAESNIDLNFYARRERKPDEIFPWDHLFFGMSKKDLYEDYIKGINETADILAEQFDKSNCSVPANYVEPTISVLPPAMRLRLRFSKKGTIKFISHLEQIEVFRRAARRSGLPIAFTAGFSSQVKSSYGPPLSIGQESASEYVELYFTRKVDIEEVKKEFARVLPEGFKALDAKRVPLNFPSIDILSNVAEYEIKGIEVSRDEIAEFLTRDSIIIEKVKKGKGITVDAKPLIRNFTSENDALKLQIRFGSGKTVKPEAVLNELLENKENYGRIYDIERTNLYIETKKGELFLP
ncbi:MAG: TIGR03960 family B12-binding radical SAM protein [Endomicrobium sp.]|nr:TIGR03960 family B12-binding radical SAM protein [Endomicrobium sp.]